MDKYQSYKSSGVNWIGDIPEDWGVIKLKYVGKIGSGDSLESSNIEPEGLFPVYGGNGVMGYYSNFNYSHSVLSIGRVGEKCGNVHKVFTKSWINDNSLVLDFNSSKFNFDYLFHTITIRDLNVLKNQNTQPLITGTIVKNEFIPYPNIEIQHQIVQFLDEKTELIDKLISTKERKITLLKEQRTSLINQVVTKGLNPNVKMKDSGIDWIGEIPEHWSVLKINHFGVVTLGKMLTPDEKEGYVLKPYLRSQNIQKERVDVSDVKEMWFTKSELLKLKLLKGDLLLNEGGDVGRTCIWNEELENCYIQNSVNRLRFIDDLQEYYLYLSNIYHFVGYYDSIVNRVSIPHLTKEKLESVKFIRPTRKEQSQIVEHLDIKTKEIDDLVHLEQKKIDLLKEYRQSLISEVVTGKIKVTQ
jgi:type I restriction enzyme S subunit